MEKYIQDYDKEYDIMSVHWGAETKVSVELFDGSLILDLDKDDNIIGIEIFNFMKEIKKSDQRLNKLLEKKTIK